MAKCCGSRKVATAGLWISVIFLIISVGLRIAFPSIYDEALKSYITLQEGTIVTKIWEDIPLPIYEKLYFFNITNSEAFLEGKEKLSVTEVGPYTFKSRWTKANPQWHPNHTVSYRELRTYHFVPELSSGTIDDFIYTLNGPMIISISAVPGFVRPLMSWYCTFDNQDVIIRKSIRELAYEGYEDDIIKHALHYEPTIPYKDGKFSWLYGKNASDDGLFTVFTGADDAAKTDIINNWDGKETLNFWDGDSCNMINGTSIETGPPIKGYQDSYTFFQSIFCRSMTFKYTEETSRYDLIAKRFRPTYSLFANSTENPDNSCFEVTKERPSGILDVSPCQFDAPVFISFPHFHLADPSYLVPINGLNPNDEEHGSHIDIEPITGVSIDIIVRFQVNVEIEKFSGVSQYTKLTEGIYPVFWAELSLEIDENLAKFLREKTHNPKVIAYSVLGGVSLLSLAGVIISIIYIYTAKPKDDDDPLIDVNTNKNDTDDKNDDVPAILLPNEDSRAFGTKSNELGTIQEESTSRK